MKLKSFIVFGLLFAFPLLPEQVAAEVQYFCPCYHSARYRKEPRGWSRNYKYKSYYRSEWPGSHRHIIQITFPGFIENLDQNQAFELPAKVDSACKLAYKDSNYFSDIYQCDISKDKVSNWKSIPIKE